MDANDTSVMKPKVSVIIPTYERREVVTRAIDSVMAQSYRDWELLVVDDGSTDGTSAMVAERYPNVQVILQENQGVSAARNVGIECSRGDWIALLDSDDVWMPRKLERQMAALAEAPTYRLCHTEEIWIRNGRRVNQMKKHAKSGGHIYLKCLPLCCISPSSVLLHRSLLDDVGAFDESFPACEDYDLWLRVTAREPVLFVEEPLLEKYGGHEDQLSRKHWGMDRFRIRALQGILGEGILSREDEYETRLMLVRKLEILVNGAKKRGTESAVMDFMDQLEHEKLMLDACGATHDG